MVTAWEALVCVGGCVWACVPLCAKRLHISAKCVIVHACVHEWLHVCIGLVKDVFCECVCRCVCLCVCRLLDKSLKVLQAAGVVKQKTTVCHHPVTLPATTTWMPNKADWQHGQTFFSISWESNWALEHSCVTLRLQTMCVNECANIRMSENYVHYVWLPKYRTLCICS